MGLFDRISGKSSARPTSAETPAQPEEAPKTGIFGRLKQGLAKTNQLLFTDVRDLFKQEGRLVDDELLGELFAILIRTDMGAGPAATIRDRVKTDFRGRVVQMSEVLDVIKVTLRELMAQPEVPIEFAASGPTVVLVVGVNGSGKTTS
ncbi:MAG: signal recognition particle-docking protein FtsY, partial [Pirellulaceae bacterium]